MKHNKIELLFRKAKSKLIQETYVAKVYNLLEIDNINSFLSLEESDQLFQTKFSTTITCQTPEGAGYIRCIIDKLNNCNQYGYYIFIDHDWEYCGCIYVKTLDLLNKEFKFGKYIKDRIILIIEDLKQRISLDCYEECGQYYIEGSVST